ncbi:hypothetical protein [Methylobacterium sp. WL119]|uniref:hypothetical protein n=1 Tax=Methylobacterium sp. WL119 TaxID=2603888 RepID=UPI001FEDACB7|nr:hypothetical protein [Methylobacterium sp. WL119]
MSAGPETERDLRAAEYVLGSLSPDERAAFELERVVDPATARAVAAWERRLGPLALAVQGAGGPPPRLGPRAGARAGGGGGPARGGF